jgi:hypothetical protein
LVHRIQFEAEFRVCQNLFLAAQNAHREFVRFFPASVTSPKPEGQVAKFVNAQLAFADTLEGSKPFVNEAVWRAFFEFENSIIMWKDGGMPKEYRKEIPRCSSDKP